MLPTERAVGLGRAALLAALLLALLAPPSWGRAAPPTFVDNQAWSASGPLAPAAASETIYVSAAADREQARSFVDLGVVALSASVLAGSTLVLQEAEAAVGGTEPRVRACGLKSPVREDGRLDGPAPAVDCDRAQALERSSSGTWSLGLARLAPLFRSGALAGVALVPQPGDVTPSTFTLAFDTTKTRILVPAGAADGDAARLAPAASSQAQGSAGTATDAEPSPPASDSAAALAASQSEQPSADAPVPAPVLAEGSPDSGGAVADPPAVAAELPVPGDERADSADPTVQAVASTAGGSSRLPAALVVLALVATAALLLARGRAAVPQLDARRLPARSFSTGAAALGVTAVLLFASETTTYKFGVVAIVFIAAVGLHILVNTAGEVSLAHAAFLGVPAFAAARISADSGLNPVLAVPIAVAVGSLLGALVALTALRARGLQVALATLAVAIAAVQYLWAQAWLVGPPEGWDIPNASLFGVELETSKSRTPVLVVLVLIAVLAGSAILRSKLGRALSLLRSSPDVAAAAGVPVARYRALAYALAGAFAGLAGGAYVIWVQQVTPQAFPLQLGFTYLLVAALAGRGGLAGVAVAAVIVQAGVLFSFLPQSIALYVAPLGLIVQITRFEGGINASLRDLRALIRTRSRSMTMDVPSTTSATTSAAPTPPEVTGVRLPVAVGTLMVVAGFGAIGLAWYGSGNTSQLWIQNQYIVSGSLSGIGLIVTGCALLLRDALLTGSSIVRGRVDVAAGEPPLFTEPAAPDLLELAAALPAHEPRHRVPAARSSSGGKTSTRTSTRVKR